MYDQWLNSHSHWLQAQVKVIEEKVAKHRKTKKSLGAKQRNAKKVSHCRSPFSKSSSQCTVHVVALTCTCSVLQSARSEGGSGWLCGNAQSYRSEDSWFESFQWQFTNCRLILGMCHPSSFTPNPPSTCVPHYRFLTPYDHSCRMVC